MMRFVQSKDVAWNHLGENLIAFTLGSEREFHHLNATAATMFTALQSPKSRDEIVALLLAEFDVTPEQANADVAATLIELSAKKLIVPA